MYEVLPLFTIVSKDKWISEVRVGVAREFPARILPQQWQIYATGIIIQKVWLRVYWFGWLTYPMGQSD
jgi:hypothetical protein